MKLKRKVRIAGIIKPAKSKTRAGAKKITRAIGRAFLPLARPAITNKTPSTIKKKAIAEKTEVNLVIVVERNSDIDLFTLLSLLAGSE
jgi:hypothetical protein